MMPCPPAAAPPELAGVVAVRLSMRDLDPSRALPPARGRLMEPPRELRARLGRAALDGRAWMLLPAGGGPPRAIWSLTDEVLPGWPADAPAWTLETLLAEDDADLDAVLAWSTAAARMGAAVWLRLPLSLGDDALMRRLHPRGYFPLRVLGETVLHQRLLGRHPTAGCGPERLDALDATGPMADAQHATLLFVVRGGRILLMHKKRGHGAGRINGPGGKVEPGETPLDCAHRETLEELCIDTRHVRWAGDLRFLDTDGTRIHGYVFRASGYHGSPTETDEGRPLWSRFDRVPYSRMWPDDLMWLPWLMRGVRFGGRFLLHRGRLLDARLTLAPEHAADLEALACEAMPVAAV